MQTELLGNGLGEISAEAWWQSGEGLPAREHAVPGAYERPAKRARTEQLLS